jgi:hypothetical protein
MKALIIIFSLVLAITCFGQQDHQERLMRDKNYLPVGGWYNVFEEKVKSVSEVNPLPVQYNIANIVLTDSIVSGDSISSIIDTENKKLGAIIFPATFTGATITILTSADTTSANFKTLQYDGTDVSVTASDGKHCALVPGKIISLLRYVKYVSASSEDTSRVVKTVLMP